jgi:CRP-like cAMP-binding protein
MTDELPIAGVRDRFVALRALRTLEPLDDDAVELLAEHALERAFPAGAVLLRELDPVAWVHLIAAGRVRASRRGRAVAIAERGDSVGVTAAIAGEGARVLAVAELPTRTVAIPAPALLDAFEENFTILRHALRLVAGQIVERRGGLPVEPSALVTPPDPGVAAARPRTFAERLIGLRAAPAFRATNLDALADLVRRQTDIAGRAGQPLWTIGAPSTFWLRINHGLVRCRNADGGEVVVGAGFVLGIMDAVAHRPRSFEAVAVTDFSADRVELEGLLAVLESHFQLAQSYLRMMTSTLIESED